MKAAGRILILSAVMGLQLTPAWADSGKEPALLINEVMQANIDMFLDPSFNYGSWIELYNTTDQDISIADFWLSTTPDSTTGYRFSNSAPAVPAHGFLNVWFGHREDYCQLQMDAKLDYDGGYISISDSQGGLIDAVWYPESKPRISWARTADGGGIWSYAGNPTPASSNINGAFAETMMPAPVIDTDSRLFTETFYFGVEIPDGATLMYTKDGSTPTLTNGMVSGGAHTVNDTKTYRFRLFMDGMLPGPVVTRSFIRTSNDYGVPVVSIVTADANLYSTEYGLFMKGPNGIDGSGQTDLCNWNRDWDRPVNVEIIDTDGSVLVNREANLCMSGRYSRAYLPHPFKLEAKKVFGDDTYFAFQPFKDKPYNRYSAIKLRNGGNYNTCRIKDAALQEIILRSGLNLDCQSYQPVHHYINGVYKGIINLREPNNKEYARANCGIDEDDIDMFKVDHKNGNGGYTLVNGSRDSWDEWLELSKKSAGSYDRICQLVDIDEFANYMAAELFLYNWDWPRNNVKAFREKDNGRYRFILFDLDYALNDRNGDTDPFATFDSEEYRTIVVTLFHNMLQNSTFRRKFIDSFCIMAASVFTPDRVNAIADELCDRAKREMAFNNESPQADINTIKGTLTVEYAEKMIGYLRNWSYSGLAGTEPVQVKIYSNIPQARLTMDGLPIPMAQFDGKVFPQAKIAAEEIEGYKFDGFIGPNNRKISSFSYFYIKENAPKEILARYSPIEGSRPEVRINEVSAANDIFTDEFFKHSDCIELYNPTDHAVSVSGMYLSNDPDNPTLFRIPETDSLPAYGFKVIWCDGKEGTTGIHAPFKLKNAESTLVLSAPDRSWADTLRYSMHEGIQSIGLYPDGGKKLYVMNRPTIGAANFRSWFDITEKESRVLTGYVPVKSDTGNSRIYNLLGMPVHTPVHGQMYIRDGKKFFYR